MATWDEMSRDNRRAAQQLLTEELLRSSVSRSYYAAYSAVTAHLVRHNLQFVQGRNNPPHEQLPALIRGNLNLQEHKRRQLTAAIRRLRHARVEADYLPGVQFDRAVVRNLLRDASTVLKLLEIEDG